MRRDAARTYGDAGNQFSVIALGKLGGLELNYSSDIDLMFVYSGEDVLGTRRLIYVPAEKETPDIAFPLRPGSTWRGTIEGKIPAAPALPRRDEIWVRYPVFGLGQPWDGQNTALAVQWISAKAVEL